MENAKFADDVIPWEKTESGEQYYRGVVQTTKADLIKSYDENGQLPTDPLLLWWNSDKYVIMGGNHRTAVWRDL
jgi:hypothetical protein